MPARSSLRDTARHARPREVDKEDDGHHLTPFWVRVRLDEGTPTKSVILFGCTAYAKVHPRPHFYVQGGERFLERGYRLLRDYLLYEEARVAHAVPAARPPLPPAPPPALRARAAFNGMDYGPEYLTLAVGDAVYPRTPPAGVDCDGWAYGLHVPSNETGWYPPMYAVSF